MDLDSVTPNVKTECIDMIEEGDRETQPIQTVFDSNQRLTADCWKEIVSVGKGEDGKERGACIHCNKYFVIERTYGSSHLTRHLRLCPMKPRNASGGGNDEQVRPIIIDRKRKSVASVSGKRKSVDVVVASVSESSCDNRERASNIVLKKGQCSLISEGKKRSATLLGLDILDCPICFEALTIPIFQCDNGHLACSSCCSKVSNKCPTCDSPVGHNRCRAMETVLESVFVPCRNAEFGCTENASYGKVSAHETECSFSQCSCPALNCNFTGSYDKIYSHFVDYHRHISKSFSFVCGSSVDVQMNIASDKVLVLWETEKKLLFALQCFSEQHGLFVTVRCIAPSGPEVEKLPYCLDYSMDEHFLTYKSPDVKRVLQVSSQIPQDNFMFIPHSLLPGELLEIKIAIGT